MRRCIDCGFLFAIAWSPRLVKEAEFDPGLLRDDEEIKSLRRELAVPDEDSRLAAKRLLNRQLSIRVHTIDTEPRSYCWWDIVSIRCLRMGFPPISMNLRHVTMSDVENDPVGTLRKIGEVVEPILDSIFDTDRTTCTSYFPYEPGLSADQHSQLLIETRRARRQRAFRIKTLALSLLLSAVTAFIVSVVAPRVVDYCFPLGPSEIIVLTPTPEASPTPTAMSLPQ